MTIQFEQAQENNDQANGVNYFWLASLQLANGSVIEPGTWYKIVSSTRNHSHSLMEEVYERIRVKEFPDMPSRQRSMFIFDNSSVASVFKNSNSWTHTDLYKVEIVNNEAAKARLNTKLVSVGDNNQLYSTHELEVRAQEYWSSAGLECEQPEVLVESPIKIIEKIEI